MAEKGTIEVFLPYPYNTWPPYHVLTLCASFLRWLIAGGIIGDGDRKRGVHAKPSKKANVLFLAKIAPLLTS